jgi:hypothetical protein
MVEKCPVRLHVTIITGTEALATEGRRGRLASRPSLAVGLMTCHSRPFELLDR